MTTVHTSNHPSGSYLPGFGPGHEGVAFVATLRGTPGRDVLDAALDALGNLHHDCSHTSGILTNIPDAILRDEFGADLPPAGAYALGFVFHKDLTAEQDLIVEVAASEGFSALTWRTVRVNETIVDAASVSTMPIMRQVILTPLQPQAPTDFEAALYRIRKQVEARSEAYFASLSRTTVVYKGLIPATRLAQFYSDLANLRFFTEIAIVHSGQGAHYTEWSAAQPHRVLAHDGQIHSERANRAWLRARVPLMSSSLLDGAGEVIRRTHHIEGALDELIELLHRSGRSLTHALRLVFPEQLGKSMSPAERAFCDYTSMVMEPWEGSGVTCFADGYFVGAILDRHGTRGSRYWVTESGLVVFASETGVVDLDPSTITKKGRLAPGEIIAVDTATGNVLSTDAIRAGLAAANPYGEWLKERILDATEEMPPADAPAHPLPSTISAAYSFKAESRGVADMLADGHDYEDTGAVDRQLTFFDRFRIVRSQLTSPNIDILAMPTVPELYIGPESDILTDGPAHARKVALPGPAISSETLERVQSKLRSVYISGTYPLADGQFVDGSLRTALDEALAAVDSALAEGTELIVLSNRGAVEGESLPVPSLLLVGAVHQHLHSRGKRARVSIIIDAGDALAPIEVAQLLAAGAQAVVPFHGEVLAGPDRRSTYFSRLNSKVYKRLLRTGVAEYGSFQGNKLFHIVGLEPELVDDVFSGVPRALGTFGLDEVGHQISSAGIKLTPLQELLMPRRNGGIPLEQVQPAHELARILAPHDLLHVTDTREGVDLFSLRAASDVLLVPPSHQDTVGPAGLSTLITELRMVNPDIRVHVRVGADLSTDMAAVEAINAGADVINLVDAEYEWVFGLLSLRQSPVVENARIAVSGGLVKARDVFIAAALGAREFNLDGAAEIDAVVEELRELLAGAGVTSLAELTGRVDLLEWQAAIEEWRSAGVDLAGVGPRPEQLPVAPPPPAADEPLDETLVVLAKGALEGEAPARINAFVTNTDASVGAKLAGEVVRRHGTTGLGDDSIRITLTGSSGVSLGAFAAPGMSIVVQGEAGDFVGKGLSGGKVAVRPEASAGFASQENVIAGSAVGYGAHSGGIYLAGEVGERLGAHNWGATIVAEGAGDGAGYRMHGGIIVILGTVGHNLGAGMEGGTIYALDLESDRLHGGSAPRHLTTAPVIEEDERILTAVIAEHVEMTNSRIGTMILSEPDQLASRFTKILTSGD